MPSLDPSDISVGLLHSPSRVYYADFFLDIYYRTFSCEGQQSTVHH